MSDQKFDLKTHVRDPKSGRVVKLNPYKLIVKQAEGGGTTWLYERPVGSGLYYYSNNELAIKESEAGLARQKKELEEASKTALEKAEDAYKLAKANVESAAVAHHAEEAKKKLVAPKPLHSGAK